VISLAKRRQKKEKVEYNPSEEFLKLKKKLKGEVEKKKEKEELKKFKKFIDKVLEHPQPAKQLKDGTWEGERHQSDIIDFSVFTPALGKCRVEWATEFEKFKRPYIGAEMREGQRALTRVRVKEGRKVLGEHLDRFSFVNEDIIRRAVFCALREAIHNEK
jgi:hypothetical protein